MKTQITTSYDDYDVHFKEYGLLVTPEGGRIQIDVRGVPYNNIFTTDKKDWYDKELLSTEVHIDTTNVDKITLKIYEEIKE